MQSHTALQTIQAILTQIESDLSHLTTNLQTEFTAPTSPQSHNPISLLTTLHTLQKALPPLRESLFQIFDHKSHLATLCRTDLSHLHQTAVSFLPIAAPNLASHAMTPARDALQKQLAALLFQSEERVETVLRSFLKAHARLTSCFPTAFPALQGKELDAALVRAVALAPDPRRVLKDVDTNGEGVKCDEGEEEKKEEVKAVKEKAVKEKAVKEKAVVSKKEDEGFLPVEKVVYNRLPRNLKIRAGKLADVNAFYKRVWAVLQSADAPLSDKQLMRALGEDDLTKMEVLRGLAVVRHSNDGWQLAARKEKTRRERRTAIAA